MIRILIFVLGLFVISCSPKVDPEYRAAIEDYRQKRVSNLQSKGRPVLEESELNQLDYFNINPKYKIEAKFIRTKDSKAFYVPTFNGKTKDYRKYGYLDFKIEGKQKQLSLYQDITSIEKNPQSQNWYYLILPFNDNTNGKGSYKGGRYMIFDRRKVSENQSVTLDFNKAYNPLCAYNSGYTCPIPPEENDLNISIKAGEKSLKR